LRDKSPQTLREAYATTINIESNMREVGKHIKRSDIKLSQPNNTAFNKPLTTDDKMDKLMGVLKDFSYKVARNDKGLPPQDTTKHFNEGHRLHNRPYNVDWSKRS